MEQLQLKECIRNSNVMLLAKVVHTRDKLQDLVEEQQLLLQPLALKGQRKHPLTQNKNKRAPSTFDLRKKARPHAHVIQRGAPLLDILWLETTAERGFEPTHQLSSASNNNSPSFQGVEGQKEWPSRAI
ncbi:hypothetical protein SELMODRAFT_430903 [Selaginella moellendorffii]|uniref:Uncharacterized protein n=1 Tax=Selaginella moellendorffii TaxID=88036 RepID=D8TAW7_SELML|nr:hypothetical protein SELMODRAFT_430903 [Selaginella moellendorffii]